MTTLLRRRSARPTTATLIMATALFMSSAPFASAGQGQIPSEFGAAGGPYADCARTADLLKQLRSGLPVQNEWLEKTRAQLKAAEEGHIEANKELAFIAVKQFAKHLIDRVKAMHQLIRDSKGIARAFQDTWMEQVVRLEKGAERFEAVVTGGLASTNYGTLITQQLADLNQTMNFFQDSGISDEGAKMLATALAGGFGTAAVEATVVMRDILYASMSSRMTGQESAMARENLQTMEEARDQLGLRIGQLQGEMSTLCSPKISQARPQESPQPIAPEGLKEEPTPPQPSHGGGGSTALKVGVTVGAAVGAGLVLKSALDSIKTDNLAAATTTTTSPTGGSGSATYRAQVTDTCTSGANGDVTLGQIGTPCSKVVGGACGAAPAAFNFAVANGAVTGQCWLSDARVTSGTYTGLFLWVTCDNKSVSGSLPGTWTMACTEGSTRPASHRVTIVITTVQ